MPIHPAAHAGIAQIHQRPRVLPLGWDCRDRLDDAEIRTGRQREPGRRRHHPQRLMRARGVVVLHPPVYRGLQLGDGVEHPVHLGENLRPHRLVKALNLSRRRS